IVCMNANPNESSETAAAQRFAGRTVLVTGGTSGIGLATAARFLAEGADTVITGRDGDRLAAAAEELGEPDRLLAVRGDASDAADLDSLVERIRERTGRLDAVFANAGTGTFKHLAATSLPVVSATCSNVSDPGAHRAPGRRPRQRRRRDPQAAGGDRPEGHR